MVERKIEYMKNKNKKFAFGMMETIIAFIFIAVVLVGTTPTITRKIVNNAEIGATLGGGTHGRYEAFIKEKLIFDNKQENSYEKYPNPLGPEILVYRKTVEGSTIRYEELRDLDGRDLKYLIPVGSMPYIKAKNRDEDIFVRGNAYVFEDGKIEYHLIKYEKSEETDANGKKLYIKKSETGYPLPDGKALSKMDKEKRIIESNLAVFEKTVLRKNGQPSL